MKKYLPILIGLAIAIPTLGATILFPTGGGTGIGTIPTYGQMLVGNSGGTYTLTATSSLGVGGGPGGASSTVQYNGGGTFQGDLGMTWNPVAGQLKLGTSTDPTGGITKLLITGGDNTDVFFGVYATGANKSGFFLGARSRGTSAAPLATLSGDKLFNLSGFGFGTGNTPSQNPSGGISITQDGPPGATNNPGRVDLTVNNGTTILKEFSIRANGQAEWYDGAGLNSVASVFNNGLFVASTTGIGTTTPSTTLSVQGDTLFASTTVQGFTATGSISVQGLATSSFRGNGINIGSGCFAVNDVCVSGSGASGITSLNGLSGASQTFASANGLNNSLLISSSGTTHTFALSDGVNPNFNTLFASSTSATSTIGMLRTNNLTVGGYFDVGLIHSTSSATSTFAGGVSTAGLSSSLGFTISGGSIGLTSGATSTWNGGHDITAGCFSINGTCITNTVVQNLAWKQASLYATVVALPANTYVNGVAGVGATLTEVGAGTLSVDGSNPAIGDRILVKNESTAANNGIYTVTATGSGIAAYVLTRSADFNSNADIFPGVATYVIAGATLLDTTWALSTTGTIVVGTTNLNFVQVAGAGTAISSLNGLTGATQTFSTATGQNTSLNILSSGTTHKFTVVDSQTPQFSTLSATSTIATSTIGMLRVNNLTVPGYLDIGSIHATSSATSTFVGGASMGGLSITGMTTGSIPFFTNNGSLSQNNANLFWDNTNLGLTIGRTVAGARLDVKALGIGGGTNILFSDGNNKTTFKLFDSGTLLLDNPNGGDYLQVGVAVTQFIVKGTGLIGVATDTPFQVLSVQGSALFGTTTVQGLTATGTLSVQGVGTSSFSGSGINLGAGCFAIRGVCVGSGAGSGTVTSVAASGGTTGLSFTGSPITTSGTLTLTGTLGIANGGTNAIGFTAGQPVTFSGSALISTSTIYYDTGGTGLTTRPSSGDLLTSSVTGAYSRLSTGASSTILTTNGSVNAWTAAPSLSQLTVTSQAILPSGTSLTILASGGIGVDTSEDQLQFKGGSTTIYALTATSSKYLYLENPTANDTKILMSRFSATSTITRIDCVVDPGSTNEQVVLQVQDKGLNGAGTTNINQMGCNNTNSASTTGMNSPTINGGDWLGISISGLTGTPTALSLTVYYLTNAN